MHKKHGIITGWQNKDDYWTNTTSPGIDRDQKYRGYLAIRALGLSSSKGSKKKRSADVVALRIGATTTRKCSVHGICHAGMPEYT
jgi:hypothetical protein